MIKEEGFNFKVIIIGDPAVGKTSLVQRFISDRFNNDYRSTIGTNIYTKSINYNIKLTIWDIAGQERWVNMRHKYYSGSHGAFIVGDLTRGETFNQIQEFWYPDLKKFLPKIPIILLGNKNDLDISISEMEVKNVGKQINAEMSIITSAKTGINVEEAFISLAKKIRKNF